MTDDLDEAVARGRIIGAARKAKVALYVRQGPVAPGGPGYTSTIARLLRAEVETLSDLPASAF
jgi:hypothetical protein